MNLSGPMFEPQATDVWKSIHRKGGAHYNTFSTATPCDGMRGLRQMFPEGEADDLNFVLFSTSGIHGSYCTIEDVEERWKRGERSDLTFLIVHPRIVCLRYGNCEPQTAEDFEFLKKLRDSSWKSVQGIGKPDAPQA
jgi:hypothetical protein